MKSCSALAFNQVQSPWGVGPFIRTQVLYISHDAGRLLRLPVAVLSDFSISIAFGANS